VLFSVINSIFSQQQLNFGATFVAFLACRRQSWLKKKVILSPKSSYILLTRVSRAPMFAICLQSTACTYPICNCNSRLPRNGSQLTPNPGQSTNSAEIRDPSSEFRAPGGVCALGWLPVLITHPSCLISKRFFN